MSQAGGLLPCVGADVGGEVVAAEVAHMQMRLKGFWPVGCDCGGVSSSGAREAPGHRTPRDRGVGAASWGAACWAEVGVLAHGWV